MRRPATALLVAICLVGACTTGAASARVEVSVFAAASLRDALEAAAEIYEAEVPNVDVVAATDSSAALRAQIEQGATPDLFLSADTTNPQALADAGLTAGSPLAFAQNELAVVVPAANPAGIVSPADLARPGVNVIAAGEAVPITAYASELVAALAVLPGYPAGYEDAYEANIVTREDNVAGVVAKISLGEGDAAIVYQTDAVGADKIATIPIPDGATVRTTLSGVLVGGSSHQAEANAFFDWLRAAEGQVVLDRFGFQPPPLP